MSHDLRFDRIARDWLEPGPVEAPSDVVRAAFLEIRSTRQASRRAGPRRWVSIAPYALAAGIVVLVGGVALAPYVQLGRAPVGSDLRPVSGTLDIPPTWPADGRVVMTIQGPVIENGDYWRAATYDRMGRDGWSQSDRRTVTRAAGSSLLDGTGEDQGTATGSTAASFTVTQASGDLGPLVVSRGQPLSVDQDVSLTLLGPAGFLGGIEREDPANRTYRITSSIAVTDSGSGQPDQASLRAAGQEYPAAIAQRFLQLEPGTIGPNASALRDRIVATARSRAPFDLAQAAVSVLRSPQFIYSVDVRDVQCGSMSIVECFATYRRGYCLHFATTMAAILRDLGVPTRLVQGFLPGTVTHGVEVIRDSDAHAWVEVYFPGHGWVAFDPTGSAQPSRTLPSP